MKLTAFFVRHPVIALVLNSLILIVGILCLNKIAIREYPEVKHPIFTVTANFPNASPELVESAVTHPLEDQLGGVEGLKFMTSQTSQGSCQIELAFKEGISIDKTQSVIRDALNVARIHLPREVHDPIIQRKMNVDSIPFIAIALSSDKKSDAELTHYANLNLKNNLRSVEGVSSVEVGGQPYTMAVNLDNEKMFAFGVNADEVYQAIEKQSQSLPVGKYRKKVPATIDLPLSKEEDFNDIFIKNRSNGKPVFLEDIAETRLMTENSTSRVRINGQPGLMITIAKGSDANPVNVSELIHKKVENLQKSLPTDLKMEVVLDQATFIKASLHNIKKSLIEAIILVLIIVFVFLRNLRATLIPLVTIPISLLGGIVLLKMFGFSINTLTLLAMVLAIGLVVDDAIVILENISRRIEEGLSPLEAAIKGSQEIAFAILAMTLTLASVYIPLAFIEGAMGQLFIEFALALAGSVFISGIVALTLSPLMCGKILRKGHSSSLDKLQRAYQKILMKVISYRFLALFSLIGFTLGVILLFHHLPRETAPKEDRGLIGVYIPYMPGKSMDAFEEKVSEVEKKLTSLPEAKGYLTFIGEWGASICIPLRDHQARNRNALDLVNVIQPLLNEIPSVDAWAWSWESGLPGMDDAMNQGELTLAISTPGEYGPLLRQLNKARQKIEEEGVFQSAHHNLKLDMPAYSLNLITTALVRSGITAQQVAKMLEIFFSGDQSLSFQKEGIRYPITIKGNSNPWALDELYLNTAKDKRISLGVLAQMTPSTLPKHIYHYNQMRSANFSASLTKDQKIEASMESLMKSIDKVIPSQFKKEWIAAAKAYQESSQEMLLLLFLAIVFIYAILSIQFENFNDPFIILLTVPLGCLGALLTAYFTNQSLNIYTQIGLITLIGLITKHGILIVEFANQKMKEGIILTDAVCEAAALRLRPILMTTAAMILGALPLILAKGAGSEARLAIGLILIGGLLFGTFLTLFILPALYCQIKQLTLFLNVKLPGKTLALGKL